MTGFGQSLNRNAPRLTAVLLVIVSLLAACQTSPAASPVRATQPLAQELVFYDWEEDMPQSVLDAFTEEYGVRVVYLVYESQEEAIDNLRAGEVYDVVVMESRFIPLLIAEALIARFDPKNLPNKKNISAEFRELAYDPGNKYSIPYNWGTTGLLARSDLVDEPVTRWTDLWNPRYAGRVGFWMGQRREVISLTLKSLGFSANSEDPQELEAALERLLAIKPHMITLEDFDLYSSADLLVRGRVVLAMGYGADALMGRERNPAIQYILPAEGALMWNDTFVIPSGSQNRHTAEVFLDFIMRPEINAMIVNQNHYATPNEAAMRFIAPEVLNNPIIFPSMDDLQNAELVLPLSLQGQRLYDKIWERLLAVP